MLNYILDLLFPKYCIHCNREGSWLCDGCILLLRKPLLSGCPDCLPAASGAYCSVHASQRQLHGLLVIDRFEPGLLREAIHQLKYRGIRELAVPLGQLLAERFDYFPELTDAVSLPVPLSPKRWAERGFNQAELIGYQLPVPLYRDILVRCKETKSQALLSKRERMSNVAEAFGIKRHRRSLIADKVVVVVDDVMTTGSTIEAAAKVVKKAGARIVWGAVIAVDDLVPP